ncbi:MAG: cyclic nucleotide-binding domain-containing protein [Chloroflexi bacterium]|nr:cyclic nucleotide-binding domain-containing protein [Chloroflexota bacterium]
MSDMTETSQLAGQLKQFELFKSLPDEVVSDLSLRFKQVDLEKDQVLFNKGDAGDALYILRRGRLKMVSKDSEGNEMVLNQVGPGAVIGEMALIDREPRSAGVVALTEAALLRLSTEDFLNTLSAQPLMGLEISRNLIQRLRFATTYIENAIEWSQLIAKGDYSFIESVDESRLGDSENASDQERAKRFLGTFFQMVQDIKAREEELKKELVKLRVEIDEAKRKADLAEITQSEFFQNLRKKKKGDE